MKRLIKRIFEVYLAFFARSIYRRERPLVIGVTGSSGKTTTKNMIGDLISATHQSVEVSAGNMNTEISLPMAALGFDRPPQRPADWLKILFAAPWRAVFLRRYPKFLVLEYAADKPGDIEYLVGVIPPDLAVIVNFGVAHLGAFGTQEALIKEKWKLAQAARQKVICPLRVADQARKLTAPKVGIILSGTRRTALGENIQELTNKTEFDFYLLGRKTHLSFGFLGRYNVANLELAALAAVTATGERSVLGIVPNFSPQEGRGKRVVGRRDILIIDESYNANPVSMAAALDSFSKIKYGRKVAILGEMKELGQISERAHQEVAALSAKIANLTIGVGKGFRSVNLDKWYPDVGELSLEVEKILQKGDAVLIKGSRFNHLEQIVKKLA